jgi:hypothetical protein
VLTGLVREVGDRGAQVVDLDGYYGDGHGGADAGRRAAAFVTLPSGAISRHSGSGRSTRRGKRRRGRFLSRSPTSRRRSSCSTSKTGQIKALVGGYDFAVTKFNHATQANRQTGSVFKPFIYAAAVEQGIRIGRHTLTMFPFQRGEWIPHNYDDSYHGTDLDPPGAGPLPQHSSGKNSRRDRRQQRGRPS